jgi:cholesterol oxidase
MTAVHLPAVVIGTGFGGAIAALRLAQAGIDTLVLERGRRWPITPACDTFCTFEKPDGRACWLRSRTPPRLGGTPIDVYTGVLDYKISGGIEVLCGAGVGGGSLAYAAISYQPTRDLFYQSLPAGLDFDEFERTYYPRVRSMLRPAPVPDDLLRTDYYLSSRLVLERAARTGLKAERLDIAVDWDIVRQELAGTKLPSIITGQAWYGVNSGAKNSVDRNYLAQAEATGRIEVRPLHVVTHIEEVPGTGYRVRCNCIDESGRATDRRQFVCRWLFLAAGSMGTTELLLRARTAGTLPRLSDRVGQSWGTNGDVLFITRWSGRTNPSQGGPATVVIDDRDNPIAPVRCFSTPLPFLAEGSLYRVGMALAKPEGRLRYNSSTDTVEPSWPVDSPTNQRTLAALKHMLERLDTPLIGEMSCDATAHPLGGAVLGEVCDLDGRVFGYPGLFVVDGALVPGSTGLTNPSVTIAALAERCLDRILEKRG